MAMSNANHHGSRTTENRATRNTTNSRFTRKEYHIRQRRGRVMNMPPRAPDLGRTYYQALIERLDVISDDLTLRVERLSQNVEEKDRTQAREIDEARRDVGELRDMVGKVVSRLETLEASAPEAAKEGVKEAIKGPRAWLGLLGVAGLYGVFELIEKMPVVARVIGSALLGLWNGVKGAV